MALEMSDNGNEHPEIRRLLQAVQKWLQLNMMLGVASWVWAQLQYDRF